MKPAPMMTSATTGNLASGWRRWRPRTLGERVIIVSKPWFRGNGMNPMLDTALFCFAVAWSVMATAQTTEQVIPANRPEATVRSLYREVQRLAPDGLPGGADMRVFVPYLSKSLRRKIDLAEACENDWFRQNHGQVVKAPFAWSEFGIFSGGNERTSPGQFHIESIRKADDGSFEIIVGFTYLPVDGSGSWLVMDHVIQESGHFVLDDVLFPKDSQGDHSALTGILSEGCKGPRWVGLH